MEITAVGDQNPIDRLVQSAAEEPVDIEAARAALTDTVEFMRASPDKARDARAIVDALGQVVTNLTLEKPQRHEAAQEFAAHTATYRTLADHLEAPSSEPTQATRTQGKQQSGAKS